VGVVSIGVNRILILFCVTLCFYFADLAKVNRGIIACLFTSGIIFTALAFKFIYGETISTKQGLSILVIVAGTVCVILSKKTDFNSSLDYNLLLSVIFALICGLCFCFNAVVMRHFVQAFGMSALQLNIDGFLFCSIFMFASYVTTKTQYNLLDVISIVFTSVLTLIGTTSLTLAI
jgi:drug/metabolite transporter (DMT)-like permease